MHTHLNALAGGALLLAGCATAAAPGIEEGERIAGFSEDSCRSRPGEAFHGQRASAETGAAILAATGATRLRWLPPDSAVTMDYSPNRVTVSYNRDYRITRVSCG